jgi:hypothetical protein
MPLLCAPTISAAIAARRWFLWVRCPACRTTQAIDLRKIDRHRGATVSSLIPALSCRSCRPHAPFAKLDRLARNVAVISKLMESGIEFIAVDPAASLPPSPSMSARLFPNAPKWRWRRRRMPQLGRGAILSAMRGLDR